MSKTWFKAVADESAGEVPGQVEVDESRGAQPLPSSLPPVIASMDSEGENSNLPTVGQDYEGDETPASTGPSKAKVTFGPGTVFDRDKSARAVSSTASEGGE